MDDKTLNENKMYVESTLPHKVNAGDAGSAVYIALTLANIALALAIINNHALTPGNHQQSCTDTWESSTITCNNYALALGIINKYNFLSILITKSMRCGRCWRCRAFPVFFLVR
jgi:hypothetical protein